MYHDFWVSQYALMVKHKKVEKPEINIKLSKLKKHPVVMVITTKKLLKYNQFVI